MFQLSGQWAGHIEMELASLQTTGNRRDGYKPPMMMAIRTQRWTSLYPINLDWAFQKISRKVANYGMRRSKLIELMWTSVMPDFLQMFPKEQRDWMRFALTSKRPLLKMILRQCGSPMVWLSSAKTSLR